ncbi:acyl-CoA dehydrogenase [Rhodobacteraceae bacterium]|nr:acyl-CoA dehydrogenase [Paracoccaceae bacterium]
MTFRSPVTESQFILNQIVGFSDVAATERYSEATPDLVEAILNEAGKLSDEVMAPLNQAGDADPARLENGVVRTSPGFAEGFRAIAEGGWVGVTATPDHGGMGLPQAIGTAITDMMSGANLALQLNPLLTQGQIEALEAHASDALKSLYLPKLISGEWSGTMNLTEPQAGSDVGALRSTATDNGDGTFAVSGQKIYITWGDADFMDNVCHLVLARLPGAPEGTKGISLFIVPKLLPKDDGTPGERNSLKVVSLEHKLGIHGSPTAVMEFDGAKGWMVGEEQGGMAAMFTMMNNARLGVAAQGIGVAEAAFQKALAYAIDRKQGKAGGTGTIVEHADVRRMLTAMKADIFAARSIALACAVAIDMTRATGEAEWKTRAALLTPIAKAFGTDTGVDICNEAIQVFGGMGFIEETGIAQHLRDVRITPIYEGTNGIQAMDLVARKMMDGGDALYRLLDEVASTCEAARPTMPELAEAVWGSAETLREATEWLVGQELDGRFAGAVPYLRATARVLGGHYHLKAALAESDSPRTALATFYIQRLLPEHASLLAQVRIGNTGLYDLSPDDLAA